MAFKIYLLNTINAAWQLAVSENKTICNRTGWLENVGLASMTYEIMRTLAEREDIDGWAFEFIDVYEEVLKRKLSAAESYEIIDIYFDERRTNVA